MAEREEANWLNLTTDDMTPEQAGAYEAYKAAYRKAKDLRKEYEGLMAIDVPTGQRMIFGYNFGRPSIAVVVDDKPHKAKPVQQTLAQYLAARQGMGLSS